jgi:hypothetical protein
MVDKNRIEVYHQVKMKLKSASADLPKGVDINKCIHTHEGNQSTDIMAVDFFSNRRFLNTTIWLVSPIKALLLLITMKKQIMGCLLMRIRIKNWLARN